MSASVANLLANAASEVSRYPIQMENSNHTIYTARCNIPGKEDFVVSFNKASRVTIASPNHEGERHGLQLRRRPSPRV